MAYLFDLVLARSQYNDGLVCLARSQFRIDRTSDIATAPEAVQRHATPVGQAATSLRVMDDQVRYVRRHIAKYSMESDLRRWIRLVEEGEESDNHRVVVFHGGRDFDQIDPKKFGTGEPGGIRPLGKGLYGGLAVNPEDMHSAIEIAKVYALKYGGKTPTIHAFEADLPSKIKNLGYDNRGWARSGGTSWEAEALPWRPTADANRAKEISVVDPTMLRKIGKWSADTPTEQIMRNVTMT